VNKINTLKLKSARVASGLRQQQLSQELGMTTKTYNEKENQKKKLWLSEVVAIAKVLKLTSEQVLDIFFDDLLTNG
jgi:DNA-binding XRE family transcriptional regulator